MAEHIELHNIILLCPCIYQPSSFVGQKEDYRTSFTYEGKELDELGISRTGNGLVYNAESYFSPEITAKNGNYERLLRAVDIAKVRNLSLNSLFQNIKADAVLYMYLVGRSGSMHKRIGLSGLTVDEDEIFTVATT